MNMNKLLINCVFALATTMTSSTQAHFPWIVREIDGKLYYYFGEGISDRTYKLPPSLASAKISQIVASQGAKSIAMEKVENEKFVGMRSEAAVDQNAWIATQATFGIYHGSRLEYYSMHLAGKLPTSREAYASMRTGMDLSVELVDTDSGIDCFVIWKNRPLNNVEVHLYCAEGHAEATATTDANGKVAFTDPQVEDGLNGIMLGHKLAESGKFYNMPYDSQSHYLTITFVGPQSKRTSTSSNSLAAESLPKLPVEVTSFGAVRLDDSLYVYGGHTGTAHSYSKEAQNDKLLQLDLRQPQLGWQEITTGARLQGLGMVAHGKQVIVVGGFFARNQEGQEHDLHSQSNVSAFDLETKKWTELAPLPEPRSSHDAAMIGSTIYVVGGWNMQGKGTTQWHTTAWSMDLSAEKAQWTELAKPPFVRRAIAAVAHDGKLFVIGGMNEMGGPTREVAVYDPANQAWSQAGQLHGESAMAGFGAAGWSMDGRLIITTFEGDIQSWSTNSNSWLALGKTKDARFFHRLLPLDAGMLISVGGANMEEGKYGELEVIDLKASLP